MKTIKNNLYLLGIYFKISKVYVIFRLLSCITILLYPIVNIIVVQQLVNSLFISNDLKMFIMYVLIFFGNHLFTIFIDSLFNRRFKPINDEKCMVYLTEQLMEKYVKSDLKTIDSQNYYDKFTKVMQDFPKRVTKSVEDTRSFLGNLFVLIFVAYYVVSISWYLIFVFLIMAVIKVRLEPIVKKLAVSMFHESTRDERVSNYVERVFKDPKYTVELKIYSIRELLFVKHDEAFDNMRGIIKSYSGKQSALMFLGLIISYFATLIVNIALTIQALMGKINIGQYTGLSNSIERFNESVASLTKVMSELIGNSIFVSIYHDYMNEESLVESSGSVEINSINVLEVNNMSFSYDGKRKVLEGINFKIKQGDRVAIVGYNGAGKTTLINTLLRLYDYSDGEILIDGENIRNIKPQSIRNNIIYIPQIEHMYSISVLEFILMRKEYTLEDELVITECLEKVGLKDKILSHKNGIHAILTKEFDNEGIKVSGGEFKRLLIARILASNAQFIIIDEILDSIDPINEQKLFDTIIDNTPNKTLIFVSHKLFTTSYASKIIVMREGFIVEEGTHQELLENGGTYKMLFEVQASKYKV